jgi:hypothetical protein
VSREPIRKEPSGRNVVVVDVAGAGEKRRQLRRRFDTYKEARTWLGETRSTVSTGTLYDPADDPLSTWIDEYWVPVLRTQVRRSTYDSYTRNLRLHLLQTLGAKPLQAIKPADLTTLYARLLASGRADHRG